MPYQDFKLKDFNEFKSLTKKDVRQFLINWSIFFENDYTKIQNFYEGKLKTISSEPFNNFDKIKKESVDIMNTFSLFSPSLSNLKWVELLELIEDINGRLNTLNKIYKWARSTKNFVGYSQSLKKEYTLSQYDNLEKVSQKIQQSSNPQNDWYQIAVDNLLKEEDYTSEGGKNLFVSLDSNINQVKVVSVVDTMQDKNILGKDLSKVIEFDSENNDLKILSPDDTFKQSILILITLKKNDNPDFPENGIQKGLVVGQNRALLNFPVLNRQLSETFANDDTMKNFTLKGFRFEEDNLFVDFEVQNRLDEIETISQQL